MEKKDRIRHSEAFKLKVMADEKWTCPTNGTHRFFKVSVEMK